MPPRSSASAITRLSLLSLLVAFLPRLDALVITEIMYHPDEADDKPYEYIELYNETADPLDLSDYSICNGVYFLFPEGTWLEGWSFVVVCARKDAIRAKYGIENIVGDWYVGMEPLSLGNGGERIEICNPGGKTVVDVLYNDRGKWPPGADGTGHSLEIRNPYFEVDDPDSWQLSNDRGGSPGFMNPCWDLDGAGPRPGPAECVPRTPVRINEAFLSPGGTDRWVELHNSSDAAVDLGGYSLTDDPLQLSKSTIQAGASIEPGGFLVLTEAQLGFSLAVTDVEPRKFIALVEPPPGSRVVDAYNFEPQFEEYSEARVPGDDRAFSDGADPTPGAPNAISVNTDVVINEIMYHPIDGDGRKEYIELYNRGAAAVDLTGYSITEGIQFDFPSETVLAAGGYLVVARDPELVRTIHGLRDGQVLGPDSPESLDAFGFLRDSGERITLRDPLGRIVDTLRYHDGGEWPEWADGRGSSLELIDARQDNRVGQAWDSSDDSEKAAAKTFTYVGRHLGGESEFDICLLDSGIALVDDASIIGGGVITDDTPIVERGEAWRYFKGTEQPPAEWTNLDFDDSTWLEGPTGIGYGDNDDTTVLTDMQNKYMTVFCRRVFTVGDRKALDQLVLSVIVDDGFYAYLNGTQVASSNVTSPAFDAPAPSPIEPTNVEIDITSSKGLLVDGENVLAVQAHNAGLGSSDLSCNPRLVSRTTTVGTGTEQLKNGNFEMGTAGWMAEGTHVRSGRTDQSPISGSGSLKIIATARGDNKVNRIETPEANGFGLSTLNLNEDLDISFKARWVVGSQSILTNGYEHEMARSHKLEIPLNLGTPGAANSVTLRQIAKTGGDLGPVITDVRHDPAVPGGAETVTVTARALDADGIVDATVYYSLNNPSSTPAPVTMELVGPNLYRASLPAQSVGTRVVFYILATDALGNIGRYPVDIRERTHPLLVNPPAASLNDLRYCIYRHDVKSPSTPYASYRFYMTRAGEDDLSSRKRLSNDPVSGSFVFGSKSLYYEAETRFSGSPWARAGWGGSFRVYMPKDKPLHGRYRTFNLEDNQGNPLDARTRITHYILRQSQGSIGVPYTEDFTLVRWQVNDRTTGVREHNWVPDDDFVSRWFPGDDEGDFLEMDDRFVIDDNGNRIGSTDGRVLYPPPSSRSDGTGDNKENYRWFFSLRAKRGADDFANFIEFAKVMDPAVTPAALFDQQIWRCANVEEMLRVFAVEMNVDDWDTWGCSRGKNCYFYRPESDGRFHLLMWDVELTYGSLESFIIPPSPTSPFNPGGFSEVNRMMNRPAVRRMYYGILREMVSGPGRYFHSSYLSGLASRLSAVGMANTGIAMPGGWIDQKAALLEARIRGVVYPQVRLTITTNGGRDFSTEEELIGLAGTAPVDASFLLVNGERYAVTHGSMTIWSITQVPIAPGPNLLRVEGFDLHGALVDADAITVTRKPAWPRPVLHRIDPDRSAVGAEVVISGAEFHDGLSVYFGSSGTTVVAYDESGPTPDRITVRVPDGSGIVGVTVVNVDDQVSDSLPFTYLKAPSQFVRGDSNGDGIVDISDGVKILLVLFSGGSTDCQDALDVNDDEGINVTDAIRVLDFLFHAGPLPAAPFPAQGPDPEGDALGCER